MVQTRGNKSSKPEIERRQFWVQRLYFQKLNCQQIVEALKQLGFNVEGSTVYRDLQDIRTQTKQIIEAIEKLKEPANIPGSYELKSTPNNHEDIGKPVRMEPVKKLSPSFSSLTPS